MRPREVIVVDVGDAGRTEAPAAVVVDVLRAFTTTPWLYARGAVDVWLASDDGHALSLKRQLSIDGPGVVAIRDGALKPGFDFGNSPGQVSRRDLREHQIVQRTANGTRGVLALPHVQHVFAASFVNASATVAALRALGVDRVLFVPTGGDEDRACVEWLQALLTSASVCPAALLDRVRRSEAARDLAAGLAKGYPGVDADDVALACQPDSVDIALIRDERDGQVRLRPLREVRDSQPR